MNKSLLTYSPFLLTPLFLNLVMLFFMNLSYMKKIHPMMYLFNLISITFMMSLEMNFTFKSWLPMILFLMMIGWLMVIFMYIISLSNNEMFNLNMNKLQNNFKMILPLISMFILLNYFYNDIDYLYNNYPNNWFNSYINSDYNNNILTILYMKHFNKSTVYMKICNNIKTPLRQISQYESIHFKN